MISQQLLQILVCPESHTPLSLADEALLASANRAVAAERLRNRAGQSVAQLLQAGLVRQDRAVLYPIVDGIPVMLLDEAIPLDQLELS